MEDINFKTIYRISDKYIGERRLAILKNNSVKITTQEFDNCYSAILVKTYPDITIVVARKGKTKEDAILKCATDFPLNFINKRHT